MRPSSFIAERFGVSEAEIKQYAATCPWRYKTYKIDKKTKGKRVISQPSRDLKVIQRFLVDDYLDLKNSAHKCSTAYSPGSSIIENAKMHSKNKYLLKLDLESYFESFRSEELRRAYSLSARFSDMDVADFEFLDSIFLKHTATKFRISVGAPSSPILTNAAMYEFDSALSKICVNLDVVYSRYADDMAFSTSKNGVLSNVETIVRGLLNSLNYPTLLINADKTVFTSKKYRRKVTGLIIANDGVVSVGRDKKREIRSQIFNFQFDSEEEWRRLLGTINFAIQVEPELKGRLQKKFGSKLKKILDGPKP